MERSHAVQRLVYGIFPNREFAEIAERLVHEQAPPGEAARAETSIHEHEIRPSDLPGAMDFARRPNFAGAVLAGACIGAVIGLVLGGVFEGMGGPASVAGDDVVALVLMTITAAILGALVVGVVGTAGKRSDIRRLESEIDRGRVLLAARASKDRVQAIARTMSSCGALQTGSM
jgi:hypothetical protein